MQGVIYLDNKKGSQETPTPKTTQSRETTKFEEIKSPRETSSEESREIIANQEAPIEKIPSHTEISIFEPAMEDYITKYREILSRERKPVSNTIHVDEIASKIANLYEKVRRIIDWKEEHLVRRTAIERILKRRLISEISEITIIPDIDPKKIARPMTLEFIRTGYFENGKIPEERVDEIEEILKKYLYILKHNAYAKEGAWAIKTKVQFYNWILEIAACEIDEILEFAPRENLLIEFMTESTYNNIQIVPENALEDEQVYLQTYIASHKALFGLDNPIIIYNVLKKRYPQFAGYNADFTKEFTENIESIWDQVNRDLEHPKRSEFQRLCEKYDAAYLIISDVMKELENDPEALRNKIKNPQALKSLVETTYGRRLETLKKRLFRSAIYSTLSIFVAGAASLFIFEYPVAKFFYGKFSPMALVADITIPTGLMFFLVSIIKPPAKGNLVALKEEIEKIVYIKKERAIYTLKLNKKVRKLQQILFTLIYLAGGFGSLYLIYLVFKIAGTPLTSLYINTANIAVIVFAAMVIRQKSKEITIKEKGSLLEFILDFFSIPLAKIGAWLSSKWKEFNFVSVFFSTLVDTPFSSFTELLEDWRSYIKDKQAEIQ